MIHRNTYINGPTVLRETWQTRTRDDLFFAGQISGVEGYVESAASGLIAGRNAAALVARRADARAAADDGASARSRYYVSHANPQHYQPTNITFGIMPPLDAASRGRRAAAQEGGLASSRCRSAALADLDGWMRRDAAPPKSAHAARRAQR